MEEGRNVVIVDAKSFVKLVSDSAKADFVITTLLQSGSLNYDNKSLVFSSGDVDRLLRSVNPLGYANRVNYLRKEKGLDE